ncbi:MAG: ATP-binding protein, partial [Saprospiraceae bacterium]
QQIEERLEVMNETKMIERNGRNLLQLVNKMLDLAKLEDQSFQLQLTQADIIPYLSYLTQSFQTYANRHNLSLRFFSPQQSLLMDFDSEQLKQIITNLISNAVKFTPSGGNIKVTLAIDEAALTIKVSDTGIGIAETQQPHIFDRFYQVDSSTTRAGEGTGIGLAHTRELVKLMDGQISVQSQLESGTTFTIVLPIRCNAPLAEVNPNSVNNNSLSLPPVAKTSNRTVTTREDAPLILIVEDNADVVSYLKSCLQKAYKIDVAYNGKIGIEKAFESIPDLIICDVMMPEKDGYEVCDTLKNDERSSHVPIILLTAKADMDSKLIGLKRGADVYLGKPFDKEELLIRIEMLLRRQQRMTTYFQNKFNATAIDSTPIEPLPTAIEIEDAFLNKVRSIVEENYADEAFSLPMLCEKIGMSRSQLYRKLKAVISQSPSEFIRNYRLQMGKKLLETTDLSIKEVSWQIGFKEPAYFTKTFHDHFGFPPSKTHN